MGTKPDPGHLDDLSASADYLVTQLAAELTNWSIKWSTSLCDLAKFFDEVDWVKRFNGLVGDSSSRVSTTICAAAREDLNAVLTRVAESCVDWHVTAA